MSNSRLGDLVSAIKNIHSDIAKSNKAIKELNQEIAKVDDLIATTDERKEKAQQEMDALMLERAKFKTELSNLEGQRQAAADDTNDSINYNLNVRVLEALKEARTVNDGLVAIEKAGKQISDLVDNKKVKTISFGTKMDKLYAKDSQLEQLCKLEEYLYGLQKEEQELKESDRSKKHRKGSHLSRTEWKQRVDNIKKMENDIKELERESLELDQQIAEQKQKQKSANEEQPNAQVNESFVSAVSYPGDELMSADDNPIINDENLFDPQMNDYDEIVD